MTTTDDETPEASGGPPETGAAASPPPSPSAAMSDRGAKHHADVPDEGVCDAASLRCVLADLLKRSLGKTWHASADGIVDALADAGWSVVPSPLPLVWRRLADEWPEDEEWVWIARTNGRQPVWLGQVDGDSIVNGVAFLRRWNEELNGLRCWLPASVPAPPAAVPTPPAPEGETTE